MRTLICIATIALLLGCKRNEQSYVQQKVTSVGPATLLADAAHLAASHPDNVGYPVDPAILPASFRAFEPVETWRYDHSFVIVTARHLQHRTGILVQPLSYSEPKEDSYIRHIKLAPGIYFYSS